MNVCTLQRLFLLRFFLPFLCVFLCLGECLGEAVESDEQNKVRIHIGELQHDIKVQLDKIQQTNEAEYEILNQLDAINRKLARQKEKATVLQRRLAEQKKILQGLKEKIEQAEEKRSSLQGHMLKRLRSFYMMGKLGMLNVTFSKRELPELMLFSDSFDNLVAYDKDIVVQYRDAMGELEQAVLSRELEKSLLEELVRQSEEEQQVLFVLRAEQKQLLDVVKQEKSLYQLAVDEMHQAEQDLHNDLMRLRIEEKLDKEQGLLLGKGRLSSPVTGTVLYRFGDNIQSGLRQGDAMKGITVAIEPGTSVHAVYRGGQSSLSQEKPLFLIKLL
ncbi:Septal ring factor EnvC, activator of murein hydrolases AmiA and AmiB, partial [Candidatus Electrothrix communis]